MKFSVLFFALVLGLLVSAATADPPREANRAYERGDFEQAETLYKEAIEANPNDARLRFNLGNALAQQGKFEEATRAYESFRAMAQTPNEKAMADYSLGNIQAAQQEWQQAMEQYREALRKAPDDPDAMYNYEYAMRQMQEEQQQENQDQGEQDQDQQGQPNDSSGEGQQGDNQEQQQPGQPGNQKSDGNDEQPADGQPEPEPGQEGEQELQAVPDGQMSQEEAEQLLNAISNREQELLKDFLKDLNEGARRNEKDW